VVRDSTLVGTNDYIQFTENFEGVREGLFGVAEGDDSVRDHAVMRRERGLS